MKKERELLAYLLLAGPGACIAFGIVLAGICIAGIGYNLYQASEGEIRSIREIGQYWTENETEILLLGLIFFGIFLWAAYKSKKMKQCRAQENGKCT